MAVMRDVLFLCLVLFVANTAACCDGWKPFEKQCYRFFPQTVTWAAAEKSCQNLGGNLASVDTQAKNTFLMSMVSGSTRAWIGGHDAVEENKWMWTDGSPFIYANWCAREPNNQDSKEHCLEINWTDKRCSNDVPCNTLMGYICAQK